MHNIIIAGNSIKTAELLANCLNETDYSVMTSDSGVNVLAKTKFFLPDLLISTDMLTDMSGYDLCKRIKAQSRTENCLVLLLYSIETRESSLKCLQAGADDFMETSFDSLVLQAKVKSLLRVKSLSDQLKEKYSELEEKNAILDTQLEMSRQVQAALVQQADMEINNLKITSVYLPAIAIGGDFYEIIPIGEGKAAIIIGDVAGHGISSALITTMMLVMIRSMAEYYHRPADFLAELNNQFMEVFEGSKSDIYLCVLAAFIDTEAKCIKCANSGLIPPTYADGQNQTARELDVYGVPIGMIKDTQYTEKTLTYRSGDLLAFYTDGLSDAFYKEDPDLFVETMSNILICSLTEKDGNIIKNTIIDEFYNKNASESERFILDDVCLVLCQL